MTIFKQNAAARVKNTSKAKLCSMSTTELLEQGIITQAQIRRFPEGAAAGLKPSTIGEEIERQFRFSPNSRHDKP